MSAFNTLVTSSVIALDEAVFAEMSMMTVGTFIRHDVIEDFQFFISSRVIFMSAVRRKTRIFFTISIAPEVFRALAAGSIAKYSSARTLKTLIFSASIIALKGSTLNWYYP
jgi:hypothetical protein